MAVYGVILALAVIQLFAVGSVIQRGKASLIPEFMLKGIKNLPEYCRMFGNRLILLSLIGTVCTIMSFTSNAFDFKPIIIFGAGIILVLVLLVIDHKKFSK